MTNESQPSTERVTVAPGRSIMGQIVVGHEIRDGVTCPVLGDKRYGPGEQLDMPVDDVPDLRAAGFIIDPMNPPAAFMYARDNLPVGTPTSNGVHHGEMYRPG